MAPDTFTIQYRLGMLFPLGAFLLNVYCYGWLVVVGILGVTSKIGFSPHLRIAIPLLFMFLAAAVFILLPAATAVALRHYSWSRIVVDDDILCLESKKSELRIPKQAIVGFKEIEGNLVGSVDLTQIKDHPGAVAYLERMRERTGHELAFSKLHFWIGGRQYIQLKELLKRHFPVEEANLPVPKEYAIPLKRPPWLIIVGVTLIYFAVFFVLAYGPGL